MAESAPPSGHGYVVAFRTHLWDAPIASLARRMAACCPGARFVVLADETNYTLDVAPFEKISHTSDMAAFGLPTGQGNLTLWFNADYAIYALAAALPDYAHYIVAEYDVAVNTAIDAVMAQVNQRGLDMVSYLARPADPGWTWYMTIASGFAEPWQALIPFLILSRRAVACLLAARRRLADRFATGELKEWAYCEGFIPSVICPNPDLRWADLSEFAGLPHFGYRPFQLLGTAAEQEQGTIAHPVLSAERMFPMLLADADPHAYANPTSALRASLTRYPLAEMAPYLQARWIKAGHAGAVAALRAALRAEGLPCPPALLDLALGKPTLQSSICEYSRGKTPAEDAAFLVSGELASDYANHTASEAPAWWLVDLGAEFVIDEVRIVNRLLGGVSARFRQFSIDTSTDTAAWTTRFVKLDDAPVSSDPAEPFSIRFSPACVGRFVRINQLTANCLHLRRVHVFGRAIVGLD